MLIREKGGSRVGRKFNREEVIDRLRAELARGALIFEAAVGTGISAKWSEAGGADLIATYNIAKYRMMGYSRVGYLPIGDANQIVLDLGRREIFPVLRAVPLIAGIFGADPTRDMQTYLDEIASVGFSGVLNCPTLALVDGNFRRRLEESGFGYQREVDMIAVAHQKGLFTQSFVTNEEETEKMLKAGVDMIICHLGGTQPAKDTSRDSQIRDAAKSIQQIFNAAFKIRDDVLLGCHGGPIAFPEDVEALKALASELQVFLGGSSAERLPVEMPIKETVQRFKGIPAGR
jgi:predicted TIM-barrel enzyme